MSLALSEAAVLRRLLTRASFADTLSFRCFEDLRAHLNIKEIGLRGLFSVLANILGTR